jgi:hypothetical protein
VGRLPSELGPWERQDYLAKLGLIGQDLVAVALRDPELAPRIKAQPTRDGRERAALRAYAEEGHPWPGEPVAYMTHLVASAPSRDPPTSLELHGPRRWTLAGGQIGLAGRPFPSKDEQEDEAPRSVGGWRVVPAPIRFPPLDDEEQIEPPRQRKRARSVRRGDPGSPDTLYDRGEIKRALELWRSRDDSPQKISQSSIARKTFPRTAVRRVIRLDEHGAFELGPSGGLRLRGIHGEFRAAPKTVSLRALERALGLKPFGRS